MKKIFLIALSFLCLSAYSFGQEFVEGKQYIELEQPASGSLEVIEFFSFTCPHCYSFEYQYQVPDKIQKILPAGATLKKYHVNFLGGPSQDLTRAWALAMALGIEDKVKTPLFEAAQKQRIKSMNDIRKIFIDNGVVASEFDGGINSFAVNGLVNKQVNAAEKFQVRSTPSFYVNGKYYINPEGLSRGDNFIAEYVETIKYLLQK